jgi:cell division protease FtsH
VGCVVKHADPVDKVTIIPRGLSLGATHFLPEKNRLSYWKREVVDQLAVAMGGRVAEEIFVGDISSGAQQDIASATRLARSMVCEWGMSGELGLVAYGESEGRYPGMGFTEKGYSEATAEAIDVEVRKVIDAAHARAKQILEENRDKAQLMTDLLMKYETLDATDIKTIMAGGWGPAQEEEKAKKMEAFQRKTTTPSPPSQNPSLPIKLDQPQLSSGD